MGYVGVMHPTNETLNRQALVSMRIHEAGLGQAEMARRMRIDPSSLCQIENGRTKRPMPGTVRAMVEVLADATGKSDGEVRAALFAVQDEAA